MRGSHAGEASGLGLDLGSEIVSAQRALLLEIVADGHEIVFRQCFMQQLTIGIGASRRRRTQGRIRGVGRENAIDPLAAIVGGA